MVSAMECALTGEGGGVGQGGRGGPGGGPGLGLGAMPAFKCWASIRVRVYMMV